MGTRKSNFSIKKGNHEGIGQGGSRNKNRDEKIVWNVAFDAIYRTLDIHGWPSLVMKFIGPDFYGNEIVKGYASVKIPVSPGSHDLKSYVFRPIQPKFFRSIFDSQKAEKQHEVDFKLISQGKGREGKI